MRILVIVILLSIVIISCNNNNQNEISKEFIEAQLNISMEHAKNMAKACPDSLFPRSYENDTLITSNSSWWCSGFYPGVLVYLYEYSGDESIRKEIEDRFVHLEKEKLNPINHDVGFKVNNSFGNMLRVTEDSSKYVPILIQAAKTLMTRYNDQLGVIRSWNRWNLAWQYAVIIDNMMNLELLLDAAVLSGDQTFYNAAISHADKTLENHFREDNSSWHVVAYDSVSGIPHLKDTHQGKSPESAWARGQAWGLYGYTMMYWKTGEKRYLDRAEKIAQFMLTHPNTPEDLIFYWDFDADDIPNAYRDVSAAAITASALLKLSEYSNINSDQYINASKKIIKNLSTPKYQAKPGTNGNFILKHSVGSIPGNSEVDVPLSYADYYYVETLMRLYNK